MTVLGTLKECLGLSETCKDLFVDVYDKEFPFLYKLCNQQTFLKSI